MPVTRAFLKPITVNPPPQGDYKYRPILLVIEANSASELQAMFESEMQIQSVDTTAYYVVESIGYQIAVVRPATGQEEAEVKYSALIHITQVQRI